MKAVTLFCALAALLGTTAVVWQRQEFVQARTEAPSESPIMLTNDLPSTEAERQAAALREETRNLARLRNEVTQLRRQQAELAAARTENDELLKAKETGPAIRRKTPSGFRSREQLQNAGYATPEAALETLFWAMREGNAEVAMQSLPPDHSQRLRFERLTAENKIEKRAEMEEQFRSEQLNTMKNFTDFAIAHREQPSPDAVVLHLRSSITTNTMKFQLQRFGDEWKIINR
jgi:hypothetical protein